MHASLHPALSKEFNDEHTKIVWAMSYMKSTAAAEVDRVDLPLEATAENSTSIGS